MEYYLKVLKNYANFNGRARRKEYWMFVLFYFIFICAAAVVDYLIETGFIITGLFVLVHFIPSLAVQVRRLHDVGKSGWFLLVGLIPIVGIWLLILYCTDSQPGANEYGENPKGMAAAPAMA
jgi:uncharacterized membrane protein YhaH (DUF805 family)